MPSSRSLALSLAATLLAACAPPAIDRPREGAPVVLGGTPVRVQVEPVPTLAPPPQFSTPSPDTGEGPAPGASPEPSPSPGASPSPVAAPSPSPGPATHVIGATDGRGANLRTGPSAAASVITTLAEGTPVLPLEAQPGDDGRGWQRVRAGEREGWVLAVVVRPR